MSCDSELRIFDMVEACGRSERYVDGVSADAFASDDLRLDAVVRNLEVPSEAARQVTDAVRALAPGMPWNQIAWTRNILIHALVGSTRPARSTSASPYPAPGSAYATLPQSSRRPSHRPC